MAFVTKPKKLERITNAKNVLFVKRSSFLGGQDELFDNQRNHSSSRNKMMTMWAMHKWRHTNDFVLFSILDFV